MKAMIALAFALALALPAPASAGKAEPPAPQKTGTITAWDGVAKTLTIKNAAGKATSFGWNERTRVAGVAKLGEHVTVSYATDKDGKAWATLITVDAPPPSTKSSTGH
jgi:ABC-type Fe3+-hydroxamate transport system substrate-binding protein